MLHLLHPALVHLTVAFLVAGGGTELCGIALRREGARRFGGILVGLGVASLLPTIVAGYLAANSLTLQPAAAEAVVDHERLGLLTLGTFLPLLVLKAWGRGRAPDRFALVYALGLAVGVALAAATAYEGGMMVYRLGVGVAR